MNTVEIKRILLLFATITLFSPAVMAADSLFENWVEHFGAYENSDESAYDLETDAAGNIYVTGISQVFGAADMVTLKYNADGVLQWQQLANLPMSVYPSRLERDNQGNIYSAGTYLFPGDPDLGSIAGPKPYLVKYDIDGNKLWDASHPIITAGFLVDLAISDNGGVYMGAMGESAGSSLFKYDSDGNQLWERFLPSNSRLNDLEVDQFGNAYLTAGYLPTFDSSSYRTWKFGNDGTLLWEARKYLWEDPDLFIFDDEIDVPWALTVDDDGNVYVAGTSWSRDAIIKYDSLGEEVWTARYAGTGWEDARAIQTDADGNVYVTGISRVTPTSFYDCLTVKYDYLGNRLWEARYDGPINNEDLCGRESLVLGMDGNIYIASQSKGGDPAYHDFATIIYDAEGNLLWQERYDGPAEQSDRVNAIETDDDGNVVVTGRSSMGDHSDIAVVKYSERTPANAIDSLVRLVVNEVSHPGIKQSLISRLRNIGKLADQGKLRPIIKMLDAILVEMEKLPAGILPDTEAEELIRKLQQVKVIMLENV